MGRFLREAVLFFGCALFAAIAGLILMDTMVMPYMVRRGQSVQVPSIVEKTPSQARHTLARYGLRLKLQEPRWDDGVQADHLITQNPEAFSMVKPGRTVYGVPSKGSRSFEVPDVRGRSLRQARLLVEQRGLVLGEPEEAPSDSVAEGMVISQEPAARQHVGAGAMVRVIVSNGPQREAVEVPDLVGVRLEEARSSLTTASLTIRDIRYRFSTAYVPDTVIEQIPAAGDSVRSGTGVRLVVSKL